MCSLLLSAIFRLAWNELQTMKPSGRILHHPLPVPSNEEGVHFKCTAVLKHTIHISERKKMTFQVSQLNPLLAIGVLTPTNSLKVMTNPVVYSSQKKKKKETCTAVLIE